MVILDVLVPQKLLYGSNIVAIHQEMGREGVPQRVDGCRLGKPYLQGRCPEGSLNPPLMEIVSADLPASRVSRVDVFDPQPQPLPSRRIPVP